MNPLTVILIAVGVWLAWRAGRRWQHHRRTWTDHQAARAAEKTLRKARWVTLRIAAVAFAVVAAYVAATGAVGAHLWNVVPAGNIRPAGPTRPPGVSCSPVPWHLDRCVTVSPSPAR